jgi:hypothetical protein
VIAICEGPGRLSLARRVDSGWLLNPLDTAGLWPCWAPDGTCIAVSTLNTGTREVRGTVELLDGTGNHLRTAHLPLPGAPPVIAPRVPHYVQWSPDGNVLSFVAPGPDALGLHISDRWGSFSSDRIASGAPIFHAWSPDSSALAIHAGTNLSVYRLSSRESVEVSADAVGFRTPVYTGASLVYAAPAPPGVSVMAVRGDGDGEPRELARFEGGVVLETVGGEHPRVSVAVTREPDSGNFHQLWLVDPADGVRSLVARGPFTAAMWSPSGDRVAVVYPTQMGDGRYAVQIYDQAGRYIAATEPLVPSQDMRSYLGFFDQYLLSHLLWSPDGEALLLSGRLPGDASAWSFADQQNDYVWYWRVSKGSPLERVAVGDMAFFRPGDGNGG